jgi:hypothetical protein
MLTQLLVKHCIEFQCCFSLGFQFHLDLCLCNYCVLRLLQVFADQLKNYLPPGGAAASSGSSGSSGSKQEEAAATAAGKKGSKKGN